MSKSEQTALVQVDEQIQIAGIEFAFQIILDFK